VFSSLTVFPLPSSGHVPLQAVDEVLLPLVEEKLGIVGAALTSRSRIDHEAMERDVLEVGLKGRRRP
jgi:hypothetical protein